MLGAVLYIKHHGSCTYREYSLAEEMQNEEREHMKWERMLRVGWGKHPWRSCWDLNDAEEWVTQRCTRTCRWRSGQVLSQKGRGPTEHRASDGNEWKRWGKEARHGAHRTLGLLRVPKILFSMQYFWKFNHHCICVSLKLMCFFFSLLLRFLPSVVSESSLCHIHKWIYFFLFCLDCKDSWISL